MKSTEAHNGCGDASSQEQNARLSKLELIAKEYAEQCVIVRNQSEIISDLWGKIEQSDIGVGRFGELTWDGIHISFKPLEVIRSAWIREAKQYDSETGTYTSWNGWHEAIEQFYDWEDDPVKSLLLRLADAIAERKKARNAKSSCTRRLATIGRFV